MTRVKIGLALVVSAALVSGGWLWLRSSSLTQVRDVEITGVTASDGNHVRASLESAAQSMTTLDVKEDTLRAAIAPYPSVAGVKAAAHSPPRLSTRGIEREPVAALPQLGQGRVPVTANGVLLRGITADRDLPSLYVNRQPP